MSRYQRKDLMTCMSAAQARTLQPGDEVRINPSWNRTERPVRKILSPTKVIAVDKARLMHSQTGVMVTVMSAGGLQVKLDAGWFYPL